MRHEIRNGNSTHHIYEPGDATRYEFVISGANGHESLTLFIGEKSYAMKLPTFWPEDLDADYVAEKMRCNEYNAKMVCEFLKKVATFMQMANDAEG